MVGLAHPRGAVGVKPVNGQFGSEAEMFSQALIVYLDPGLGFGFGRDRHLGLT